MRERGTVVLLVAALCLAWTALAQGESHRHTVQGASDRAAVQQAAALETARASAARYFADPQASQYVDLKWWRSTFDLRGYAFREHVGFAVKPVLPGAAFSIGQGDLLPGLVRVRAESMDSVRTASELEHPTRLATGRFDLLFVVVYLWPLVLLTLTLSVLTQDRETKRLASLALQGVTPRLLVLAQVLARCLVATALLILAVGIASMLAGALPGSGAGLLAFAEWAAITLAYSFFWAAVAGAVCAIAANRTMAAFAGFGAWVGFVILIPALLTAVVSLAVPLPSREGYVVAMRDAGDRVNADRLGLVARFYDEHPAWRPQRTSLEKLSSSVTRFARAAELERALATVERSFDEASDQQSRFLDQWSLLSPATLAYDALARLGGNDLRRHRAFLESVRGHQLALREHFQARIQQAALRDEQDPCKQTCLGGYGFTEFDAVPRYQASAVFGSSPEIGRSAMALTIWGFALLALLAVLLRQRPRVSTRPALRRDCSTV